MNEEAHEFVYSAASDVCDKLGDHNKHTFDVVVWGIETALEAHGTKTANLETVIREMRGLLLDLDLGRSIHNSRKPQEQSIDGPLWAQIGRVTSKAQDILDGKSGEPQ